MSKQIKKKLDGRSDKVTLSDAEFDYLNSLNTVGQSFAYYIQQLKTEFLQTLTLNYGYKAQDNLELSIDLKSDSHELLIKVLDK